MDSKGNIKEFTVEQYAELKRKDLYEQSRRSQLQRDWTPISEDQARFFKTKGMAFRQLWGKRLNRGLSKEQAESLDAMVAEFVKSEEIKSRRIIQVAGLPRGGSDE